MNLMWFHPWSSMDLDLMWRVVARQVSAISNSRHWVSGRPALVILID